MMAWLAMLGFAAPFALAALPLAIGALIYAYRKRGRGDRFIVASTLLLSQLQRVASAPRKFSPPIRFFIELAILATLSLAAAGMLRNGPGSHVAVIVDNSFSMRAKDPTGQSALTRAKEAATQLLHTLPGGAGIDVFVTSPAFQRLTDTSLPPSSAEAVVSSITPSYGVDSLEGAMSRVAQSGDYDRVSVFTDKLPDPAALSPSKRELVTIVSVQGSAGGLRRDNITIGDIALEDDGRGASRVQVSVVSYAGSDAAVTVELEELDSGIGADFSSIATQSANLPAGREVKLEFPASARDVVYRATLKTSPALNQLEEDDAAVIATQRTTNKVLLVSDLPASAIGLDRLRHFQVESIKPEQFDGTGSYDGAVILHRFVPAKVPVANALIIMPSAESGLAQPLVQADDIQITHWSEGQQLLQYLNLPVLVLKVISPLKIPSWGRELISSTRGKIAFAGELKGRRYVVTGFDLFPFEPKSSPVTSIFLLNILKWLSGGATNSRFEIVGGGIELPAPSARARLLGHSADLIRAKNGSSVPLLEPGVVEVINGADRRLVPVNFFTPEESDLRVLRSVTPPPITPPAASKERADESLVRPLAYLALLLLFIDLAWSVFREYRVARV